MTDFQFTTEVLDFLKQPWRKTEDSLIITPTSSPMLECLPGTWVSTENATELHVDLKNGEFLSPRHVAELIVKVASTI